MSSMDKMLPLQQRCDGKFLMKLGKI